MQEGETSRTMLGANRLLWVLTIVNLFNFIDRYVLSAVLEPIKAELNIKSDADMGRMATVGHYCDAASDRESYACVSRHIDVTC